jgi:hypothetical protein
MMKILLTEDAERSHLGNFISWSRLMEQLRRAGEFREDETAVRLEVDESGITYFVSVRGG